MENPDADTRSADDTIKEMAGALEAPKKEDAVTVCPFETVPHDLKSTRKATKKIVKKKARAAEYKNKKQNTPKTPGFIRRLAAASPKSPGFSLRRRHPVLPADIVPLSWRTVRARPCS